MKGGCPTPIKPPGCWNITQAMLSVIMIALCSACLVQSQGMELREGRWFAKGHTAGLCPSPITQRVPTFLPQDLFPPQVFRALMRLTTAYHSLVHPKGVPEAPVESILASGHALGEHWCINTTLAAPSLPWREDVGGAQHWARSQHHSLPYLVRAQRSRQCSPSPAWSFEN